MIISPALTSAARELRRHQTPWEKKMWARLKNRNLSGQKFLRQFVLGNYIFDFCCQEQLLLIELDGSQHKLTEHAVKDREKQGFAEQAGYNGVTIQQQ